MKKTKVAVIKTSPERILDDHRNTKTGRNEKAMDGSATTILKR